MPTTSPRISFGLFALELKLDADLSTTSNLQPFAKLTDLETDNSTPQPYTSYEPDFWLLSGAFKFLPPAPYTTVHVGLMSLEMSDAAGDFAVPPVLTVTFGEVHSADGLALRFNTFTGDYCNDLDVAYYDSSAVLIRTDNYNPTGAEFSTGQAVDDFKKIVITFNTTSRPYRYLRLIGIDYGELIIFDGTAIKAASVVEEVNQISVEVPFSTLEMTLFSQEAQFSILNPAGQYIALKERQPLFAYEIVDGVTHFIGRFYLSEWENLSDTDYRFSALDMLGVLDTMDYRGGIWTDEPLEDLVETILGGISVPYVLDNQLLGIPVRGWLPTGSYRQALQQIGFAVGASVACTRLGSVQIYKTRLADGEATGTPITKGEKSLGESLSLRPVVTGVEVTAHDYIPGGEAQLVMSGEFDVGVYDITFDSPMHALSVTGATIVESGVNYAVIAVTVAGTVALTGLKYIDTTSVATITTQNLTAGSRPNVLKIENATLVHKGNLQEVAQRVYDYSQQRYLQKAKLYASLIQPGETVLIDALYDLQLQAVVAKMELDLALGFTARVEMIGVVA